VIFASGMLGESLVATRRTDGTLIDHVDRLIRIYDYTPGTPAIPGQPEYYDPTNLEGSVV